MAYTTQAKIERLFSSLGVRYYSDHDETGVTDTDVVTDCISQSDGEIDLYCRGRYSEAGLSGSTLIERWSTILATCYLCERRGNPVPDSLAKEADRIYERLEKIQTGAMQLPGVAFGQDLRPAFSNLTVDRRYRYSKIRVTTPNSSNQTPKMVRHDAHQPFVRDS